MPGLEILLDTPSICIAHDHCNQWLYVDWKGEQNESSIWVGRQQLVEWLRRTKCQKMLNDNSNLEGPWQEASQWLDEAFFQTLADAGLHYLAWVYSPNYLSRSVIDDALSCISKPMIVSFEDVASAYTWLRESVRHHQVNNLIK
ncbi:hypothetical protein GCM10011375_18280 [Hymenobacter qilianensis]|uniref:Uncharacterized protein n=1 Tax=Hymenobacter qilianensis TaxID=1385715 RepID=A0ACB5PQZ7_9BACT|nr:hypothetical protein [Hymenobacter qilianensis]GGF63710.1 hypothetical protein GCM10011375_18280 [Hymenobacter qilianensis]